MAKKKGFEFRDHKLELLINGVEFEINMMPEEMSQFKRIQALSETISKMDDQTEEGINEIVELLTVEIGVLLNDDKAIEKIFKDREVKLFHMIDILYYIYEELSEYSPYGKITKELEDK